MNAKANSPLATCGIFDLDGTLADTMPLHFRAWREIAPRYGLIFSEDRFYALGGVPTVKIAAILAGEQGITIDPVAVAKEKELAFLARFDEVQPIGVVVDIAREWRQRGPVAVASGGGRAIVERTLRQIGLGGFFPVVVTAEDTERHKPEPDVFLEAARQCGVQPSVCTVHEDTDIGLEAARRAGMRSVDVRSLRRQSLPPAA